MTEHMLPFEKTARVDEPGIGPQRVPPVWKNLLKEMLKNERVQANVEEIKVLKIAAKPANKASNQLLEVERL